MATKNTPQETAQVTPPQRRSPYGVGKATAWRSDKYKSAARKYPLDLFSPTGEYGGNFVVFYINVPEDSKLVKPGEFNQVTVEQDNNQLRGAVQREGLSKTAAIVTGGVAGGGYGAILNGPSKGAAIGAGASAVATTGANSNASGKMTRQTKRLAQSIALYVPHRLQSRYSVNWQDQDLALPLGLAQATDNIAEGLKAFGKSGLAGAKSEFSNLGPAAQALALGTGNGIGDMISAAMGKAVNPKKEQIFKGVDFRTFTFDYNFAPKSEQEANEVLEIIKLFKLHMHPEYSDTDNYLFIYPSEFDIYYYTGTTENTKLYRHTTCVLQEVTVDYTPNNSFSTFSDGTPTQINMTLVFRELAILTKDEILDGF